MQGFGVRREVGARLKVLVCTGSGENRPAQVESVSREIKKLIILLKHLENL